MWEYRWKQDEAEAPPNPSHTLNTPTAQHPQPTVPLPPTTNTQLPTYVTASPVNVPIAYQVHIPTAHVITDPDPRTVIKATMKALRRPIPPDTMRYIDSINRQTDAQLAQDADTRRKRGRQM